MEQERAVRMKVIIRRRRSEKSKIKPLKIKRRVLKMMQSGN